MLMAGTAASQAPSGGAVAGRVTDGAGHALPGVRVTVVGGDGARETVSDADGGFAVANVAPGSYIVTAELAGFEAALRRIVVTTRDARVDVPLTLALSLCDHDLVVDPGFRDMVLRSDAIVHARVTGVAPTPGITRGCSADAFTYTATVVDGIKGRPGDVGGSTIRWVQDSDVAGPQRGEEYLVFLAWDASNSRYSAGAGLYVFPVSGGRIEWHRHDAPGINFGDPVTQVADVIRAALAPLRNGR